jgi:hypothetical protein
MKEFFSKLNISQREAIRSSAHKFLEARVQNSNDSTPTKETIEHEINLAYAYAIQLYKFNEKLNSGL